MAFVHYVSYFFVLWGFFNLVLGCVLICRVAEFNLRVTGHVLAAGLGALLLRVPTSRHFGRFHGGNSPS